MTGTNEPTEDPATLSPPSPDPFVERFRSAWQQGSRPVLEDYLPADESRRLAVLAELIRVDLEYRLKSGESADLDAYLGRFPELAADALGVCALSAVEKALQPPREPTAAAGKPGPTPESPSHCTLGDLTNPLSPPLPPVTALDASDGLFWAPAGTTDRTRTAPPTGAASPDRTTPSLPRLSARPEVAGYELLGELGRGGMGVVYKARHLRLKRLVALKMILTGPHAGPSHLARFRAEAEAAARLQHPNVVQVYEVGEQDGRPYFSLEYVEGGSLAQRLAREPLAARPAAGLVETLARAVHYAHQRGVIHRDLKPANILLRGEGRGARDEEERASALAPRPSPLAPLIPKIADFGLAKQLDDDSGQTQSGQIMGTPSYMAPEQARGLVHKIGPATDVYALGAILYECLTGRPPFRGASLLDTLEQVRKQEPVPPSRLQPKVPRDLETICLKCLQKEAAKRYASAHDLADDLRRFQQGDSIQARPMPVVERLVRWARRRPAVAALLLISGLAVLSLVGGGLWYNARLREAVRRAEANEAEARGEREEARRQQGRAAANFVKAQEAVNQLLTRVGENRLAHLPGMDEVRRDLLEDALRFYQGFLKEKDNPDPAVRRETGLAYVRVAYLQQGLGQPKPAEEHFQEGLLLLEKLAAEFPRDAQYRKDLATAYHHLATFYQEADQKDRAETYFLKALGLWSDLTREHPEDAVVQTWTAQAYNNLGNLYSSIGRRDEAERMLKKALALREQLAAAPAPTEDYRRALAQSHHNLGGLYLASGRAAEAEKHYLTAEALFLELAQHYPRITVHQAELAACYNDLGCLYGTGRPALAEAQHKQALDLRSRIVRDHPQIPDWQDALAGSHYNLGGLYLSTGRLADAENQYLKALALRAQVAQDYGPSPGYQEALAQSHLHLGALYDRTKRQEQAEAAYRKAAAILEPVARAHPEITSVAELLGKSYFHLGLLLSNRGQRKEAIAWSTRCIATLEPILAKDPRNHPMARQTLAGGYALRALCLQDSGRPFEAIRDLIKWKALDEPARKPPGQQPESSKGRAKNTKG